MKQSLMVLPFLAGLALSGCNGTPDALAKGHEEPAKVEHLDGSDLSRITLSPKASERLGIQIAEVEALRGSAGGVRPAGGPAAARIVVPYAAVLYDANGNTWVYTNPEPLVFIRHSIRIERIEDDLALLSDGPPVGTRVVTVGAAELFGAEFEIGH